MARRSGWTWPSQTCPELGHPITPLTCCCHSCSLLRLRPSPPLSSHTNNQLVVVPPPGRALPTTIWQLLTAVQGIPDQVRQILRQPPQTFLFGSPFGCLANYSSQMKTSFYFLPLLLLVITYTPRDYKQLQLVQVGWCVLASISRSHQTSCCSLERNNTCWAQMPILDWSIV